MRVFQQKSVKVCFEKRKNKEGSCTETTFVTKHLEQVDVHWQEVETDFFSLVLKRTQTKVI